MATQLHIDEEYRGVLASAGLAGFEQVMAARMGAPVSVRGARSTVRLTVTVDGRSRELYLKRAFKHATRALLREWLRGRRPQAEPTRECRLVARLSARGIRTARVVAWGERSRWLGPVAAFAMFEAVPGAFSLDEVLEVRPGSPPLTSVRQRRRILADLAELVRRLHDADLRWPELVAKHILVALPALSGPAPRPDGGGAVGGSDRCTDCPRLWLVGVTRMHASGSARLRVRNFVSLLRSIPADSLSRADLLRFAFAYARIADQPWRQQKEVLARDWGWAAKLWGRARREATFAGSAGYEPGRCVKLGSIRVDERYLAFLGSRGVTTFDAVFKWQPAEMATVSANGSGVRFELPGPGDEPMILRLYRFDRPRLADQFRRIVVERVTRSSAGRLWRRAAKLHKAGVSTALPVAYGEKMRGWWERRSFVLFREPPGLSVRSLAGSPDGRLATSARRAAVRRCGALLGRLHKAGLRYGGRAADGLILSEVAAGELEPCCPDPGALVACRTADRSRDVADLLAVAGGLGLSRTDLLRFARPYLGSEASKAGVRSLIEETGRAAGHR
ncbi:MAG: hypothetical protein GXY55_14565 [Phycisphaerae bacterium]|nr:hypothetical protein [Phycisphaerae bacterium]